MSRPIERQEWSFGGDIREEASLMCGKSKTSRTLGTDSLCTTVGSLIHCHWTPGSNVVESQQTLHRHVILTDTGQTYIKISHKARFVVLPYVVIEISLQLINPAAICGVNRRESASMLLKSLAMRPLRTRKREDLWNGTCMSRGRQTVICPSMIYISPEIFAATAQRIC